MKSTRDHFCISLIALEKQDSLARLRSVGFPLSRHFSSRGSRVDAERHQSMKARWLQSIATDALLADTVAVAEVPNRICFSNMTPKWGRLRASTSVRIR
jgi:hypothetical protein